MLKDYIKFSLLLVLRQTLKIYHFFPLKHNRIVFYSFNGKQYSCNPRQISEYLTNNCGNLEIVWAFKKPDDFKDKVDARIKIVKYRSISYYYYAKTAKVLVQNVQGFGELSRRKNQAVIQTWHASNGYKQQGNCKGIKRKLELLYHRDYSYVMSGSKSMIERRVRGTMGFRGQVLSGTPRMDIIINQNDRGVKRRVYQYFGVNENHKLLLYAPTWRKDRKDNEYGIEYGALKQAMEDRFGGEWLILVRLHPNVYNAPNLNSSFLYDATKYPDMQDLLYCVDALVSDYSSCIWDYSFTYRPCFLYCNDLKKYGQDRNFDIPISQWRFPIAENMEELIKIILDFNSNDFIRGIQVHHQEMGNLEDGHATERVCKLISILCKE